MAALPLGAVLVGQAVLHFSTEVFRWASIATGIWALLYVVISLDPAVREKIDTARSLVDTVHEARRGNLPIHHRKVGSYEPTIPLSTAAG